MKLLDVKSKAATLLLRNYIGMGYCAGKEFPGQTIRLGLEKLYKIGYLADDLNGRMIITDSGKAYIKENHIKISLGN